MTEAELVPEQGWVAPRVAEEFPGIAIAWVEVEGPSGKSPEPVRRRLRQMSDRFHGGHAHEIKGAVEPDATRASSITESSNASDACQRRSVHSTVYAPFTRDDSAGSAKRRGSALTLTPRTRPVDVSVPLRQCTSPAAEAP